MIGVGEEDLNAEIFSEIALGEPFDCGLRADRHEDRRFDGAVSRVKKAGAGASTRALGQDFKSELRQVRL